MTMESNTQRCMVPPRVAESIRDAGGARLRGDQPDLRIAEGTAGGINDVRNLLKIEVAVRLHEKNARRADFIDLDKARVERLPCNRLPVDFEPGRSGAIVQDL